MLWGPRLMTLDSVLLRFAVEQSGIRVTLLKGGGRPQSPRLVWSDTGRTATFIYVQYDKTCLRLVTAQRPWWWPPTSPQLYSPAPGVSPYVQASTLACRFEGSSQEQSSMQCLLCDQRLIATELPHSLPNRRSNSFAMDVLYSTKCTIWVTIQRNTLPILVENLNSLLFSHYYGLIINDLLLMSVESFCFCSSWCLANDHSGTTLVFTTRIAYNKIASAHARLIKSLQREIKEVFCIS